MSATLYTLVSLPNEKQPTEQVRSVGETASSEIAHRVHTRQSIRILLSRGKGNSRSLRDTAATRGSIDSMARRLLSALSADAPCALLNLKGRAAVEAAAL